MLKLLVISGFLAIMLVAAPAVAQSAAPAGDQSATPPADQGATPPLAGQGATTPASTAKALIASCQSDAESKGLKGADLQISRARLRCGTEPEGRKSHAVPPAGQSAGQVRGRR